MPGLELALVLLIAFATLAFGGVYPWGYATIAVAGATLGVWAAAATRAWTSRRFWTCLGLLVFIVVALLVSV